ncbi:hypothetical protein MBOU_50670 [Mycobacterium bourgelatii]|uniref:Uncharacterized protein n=1 Tax=Mycobacterium bourgelatii TaxID=1273442 RepID=A0A7I9YWI9_MYCBU|nr:hypothetical protein MBOU_50670 [Mycobacterium bourgelatii]
MVDHAVEAVPPAVVLAGKRAAVARRLLLRVLLPDHLVATVCAHVVERVDVVVQIAGDHNRRQPGRRLAGEVGTLARQAFQSANAQPRALEDRLAFGGEELLGYRVLIVHRTGAQLGIFGGELAAAGGQLLLDARHDFAPWFSSCRQVSVSCATTGANFSACRCGTVT